MKGTFFRRPLEFNLLVQGESWHQGEEIRGDLTVKNHGTEPTPLAGLKLILAHGSLSAVRKKNPNAFKPQTSFPFDENGTLAPGQSQTLAWTILTDRNCPITDKSSSLFLLYGEGDTLDNLGQLQLMMEPDALISDVLNVFQTQFRFVVKSLKASKGEVEVKLSPPESRAFGAVEQLAVRFRFDAEALLMRYSFQVKKLEASAASMDVKKTKLEFDQSFTPDEYRIPSGRFNHERFETAIQQVLEQMGITP